MVVRLGVIGELQVEHFDHHVTCDKLEYALHLCSDGGNDCVGLCNLDGKRISQQETLMHDGSSVRNFESYTTA